jgi:Ca2+-binding RTX toxin-like protein
VLTGSLVRDPGEAPGTYAIRQGTLAANTNYVIQFTAGILTINASASNTAPTVSISTPSFGLQGESTTIQLTATDVDAIDQSGSFTFMVQWGDGTSTTVTGSHEISLDHIYATVSVGGFFTITATATDSRGGTSDAASRPLIVSGWTVTQDPFSPCNTVLTIVGTNNGDNIQIRSKNENAYDVRIVNRNDEVQRDGTAQGAIKRIVVFAYGGDDKVSIERRIEKNAVVYGGSGDDDIDGGSGNDILFGESGEDKLSGNDGRDILIGGPGTDRLQGNRGDDILIAGLTIYDPNFYVMAPAPLAASLALDYQTQRTALDLILAEWASTRTYVQRRQNLSGIGTGARLNGNFFLRVSNSSASANTVFDDGAEDRLRGDAGTDWFFANAIGDRGVILDDIRDRSGIETIEDLDCWW